VEDKQKLIASLAHWLAAGQLELRFVLPAIQELTDDAGQPAPLLALLDALDGATDEALASLATHLRAVLRMAALRVYEKRKQGQPVPEYDEALLSGLSLEVAEEWRFERDPTPAVETAIRGARDLGVLALNHEKAPQLFREVQYRSSEALAAAYAAIASQMERGVLTRLQSVWPGELPGRDAVLVALAGRIRDRRKMLVAKMRRLLLELPQTDQLEFDDHAVLTALQARFATAETREDKAQILDCLCSWPTAAGLASLREMAAETWVQDRVMLNLTLRFGEPRLNTWEDWLHWVSSELRLWQVEQQTLAELIEKHPHGLLLILYSQLPDRDPTVFDSLVRIVHESGPQIEARDLIQFWLKSITIDLREQRALLGVPEPVPPPLPATVMAAQAAGRLAQIRPPPLPVAPEAPAPPSTPSLWEKHIQPLFVENWYIVAGIAMVILGSSLLAYYTWDKHWLVRYTIMPSLLALFTWSLAGVGRWIEKKGSEFKSTAAILRGAAIGLLPINFMAMALLSSDEKVPQKGPALLAMAAIYFSVFGWSLRNWCAAVEPALRNRLAGALLLLNSLVAVGPLARTFGHLEGQSLLVCLGTGFYLGFFVAAWTIVHFTRTILTREMAAEKRVPWFVAAALAITFLQVFVWVHGFMRHVPHAHTYALLIILTGWLILYSERRALELRQSPTMHGGESFLGFAFVLLGLLMGFTEPTIRIVSFAAAGVVWIYQGLSRREPLHYWIALTLLALAVASIGLLPQYPGPWLPFLGVVLALGFGLGAKLSPVSNGQSLAEVCRGMQAVALFLTTMVAPLVQWHYGSEPLATGGWLIVVAALFAWRSLRDQKIHWLHATMVVLALALPYLGFVDMAGRTAHHNTMVFGLAMLSWLWLGVTLIQRSYVRVQQPANGAGVSPAIPGASPPQSSLILQARSTVLWFYGSLAVAAMLLRVVLGDTAPVPLWYRDYMDYAGPLLMMLALIPATYCSRSLVPAAMAVVLMAVLFPELKANLQQTLPWLSWGTGLASAIWGLALAWLCFFLRRWAFLRNLPEGDRFMGQDLFPFRRYDYSLFTWPIMAAALFLIIKVDTWNLFRNQLASGVPLKTAIAVVITGSAWTFIGIYHREDRNAVAGIHLGWVCALTGIAFGYWRQAADPYWTWPFLITGLLLQALYWIYRFGVQPAHPWANALLTEPMRAALLGGSAVLAVVAIGCLLYGTSLERLHWLYWFLAAQLIWHALGARKLVFGAILFFQIWIALLSATAHGAGPLWDRVSAQRSITPTLWLLLGVQLVSIVLENVNYPSRPFLSAHNSRLPRAP